jgi:hypothetical protein
MRGDGSERSSHDGGKNRAAVALANKNGRIVWTLLAHDPEDHVQVTAEDNVCRLFDWSHLSEARCTPTLMTREVRPASPDAALRHDLRGHGGHTEKKRALQ